MEKFLNNLYSYDNFGIYLIIAILILIVLFFVVLFFGRKDKKNRELEETKRLEKLNPDLFKIDEPVKEEPIKIEEEIVPIIKEDVNTKETENKESQIETNKIEIPNVEPQVIETSSVTPVTSMETTSTEIAESKEPITMTPDAVVPILEKIEEKPLIVEEENFKLPDVPNFNLEEIEESVEEIKEEAKEDDISEKVEEKVEVAPIEKNVEIFSSV